ncbi:uncharacterized protein LOC127732056 isoform X3 [Mytilus californianus]|uniref:uncharacterized protein LOC127732056 isoform X3 n=1 Tax=Mytilus californianus TaxID=6549 RepID=UPI002247DD2F|nr:uncharacterized protein LOC127732056 isoform X3 [Mytilus californianus]
MEKPQIPVLVFLTLWNCEELNTQNVTFYNINKSWKDAVNFCSRNGGVLESNITLLKEEITDLTKDGKNNIDDVWFGKYRLLTNWTYIRGCFLLNGVFEHFVIEHSNAAELQCQLVCDKYTFYSLKGTDCYCIGDIDSFVRRKNCNCVGCYKVWEHLLPDYGTADADKNNKCIAASECLAENHLKRSYEKCNKNYDVTCDNDAELNYTYPKYKDAADECERQGSFIKWHSDNLCVTNRNSIHQYWTSGTRKMKTFLLRKAYSTEHLQLQTCFKLDNDHEQKKVDNCNYKFSFFCRFGTDEDKGDMKSIPKQQKVQSDDSGSIAAGIVTSIIALIVVISVLVFIHRRRLSRKKPTIYESQKNSRLQDTVGLPSNYDPTSEAPIYNELDADNFDPQNAKLNCSRGVSNITYDQVNSKNIPKPQNGNQSANNSILTNLNSVELQRKDGQNEYEMAKVINVNGNSSEVAMSSDYCLAKPISSNTEEESDPYEINKDYDHLNNVKKKEDPITKVYDHLPTTVTDDPTYDHSHLNSASDNGDYYDHFKNDGDYD